MTRRAGAVTVTSPRATITLSLGEPAAERWEKKLGEAPKPLVDKLDVKPGATVLLIGTHDDTLRAQIAERTSKVSRASTAKNRDVVFVDVRGSADMSSNRSGKCGDHGQRSDLGRAPEGPEWHRRHGDLRQGEGARADLHESRARLRHIDSREARSPARVARDRRPAKPAGARRAQMSDRGADGPLLLYDGSCGFCADTVQFVLRHDVSARTLRFASLQGPTGAAVRARHPALASTDSVVWLESIDDSAPLVRSDAALRVLRYLGGAWSALETLARIVPKSIRDGVYDLVARHRHRLSADGAACVIPTAEERARYFRSDGGSPVHPSTRPPVQPVDTRAASY